MDSISNQVIISFGPLDSAVSDTNEVWQLLLKVVANLTVLIEGRKFYEEEQFPVVEFATQAMKWLREDAREFQYNSMESDANPLLEFRQSGDGKLTIFSPFQKFANEVPIIDNVLRASISTFLDDLSKAMLLKLGLSLEDVFRRVQF